MKQILSSLIALFILVFVVVIYFDYPKQPVIPEIDENSFAQEIRYDPQEVGNYSGISICDSSKGMRNCSLPLQTLSGGRNINDLSFDQIENRFYQLIMKNHIKCRYQRRFGHVLDGGWDMCIVGPYHPSKNCLVYSIGIRDDFSFDDAISKSNCTVRSFDPTTKMMTHDRSKLVHFYKIGLGFANLVLKGGWQMKTFGSLLKQFNEENKVIDFLKIDVDFAEWGSFITMFREGSFKNVKQIGFELHTRLIHKKFNRKGFVELTREDYIPLYEILYQLEQIGFRRYKYHVNPQSFTKVTSERKTVYSALELYYININFLKDEKIIHQ